MAFGQVIAVTGLNYGYPGKVSRMGDRVIASRQVLSTTANPITFGSPVVIVTDCYQSVADYIAGIPTGNAAFTAALFAGIAVAEVTTTLAPGTGWPYSPGSPSPASYLQGTMAEALERGSLTLYIQPAATGSFVSQAPLYIRVAPNATYSSALVGGFEVAPDAAVNTTGTASSGSTAVTLASGTGVVVGQIVTGTGIAPGTAVKAIAGTALTLSQNTTASLSTTALNFASTVQIPGLVLRTGAGQDSNGAAEATILNRVAA